MSNILPHQEQMRVRQEYRRRFLIIVLCFILILITIGGVLLAPSYLLVLSKEKARQKQLAVLTDSSVALSVANANAELASAALQMSVISRMTKDPSVNQLFKGFVRERSAGITITAISYQYQQPSPTVSLTGRALTREDMLAFKKRIERVPGVDEVSLPVAELARERDVEFTFSIRIHRES